MEAFDFLSEKPLLILRLIPSIMPLAEGRVIDYEPLARMLGLAGIESVALAQEHLPPDLEDCLRRQGIRTVVVDAVGILQYGVSIAIDNDLSSQDAAMKLAWGMVKCAGRRKLILLDIPLEEGAAALLAEEVLLALGPWLKLHGPIIRQSSPWGVSPAKGPCCLSQGNTVIAFFRQMPQGQQLFLNCFKDAPIRAAALVGAGEAQWYQQDSQGLTVHCAGRRDDAFPVALAITV